MTLVLSERSENYIPGGTGGSGPEVPAVPAKGLDFLAEERVNPEGLIGGTPTMQDHESDIAVTEPPPPVLTSTTGLEHLFDSPRSKRAQVVKKPMAVIYLRVSTSRQTHTGADVDEDGNSIATQREHTMKKGQQLQATILREFVEPGASARSIAKRPIFKEMLRFIDEHPEVTHVIAYQRSRMFRSVADSAIVESALAEQGIEIVSAKEDYGNGADGMVMKTITDAFNQWQSQKNGEDISLKMAHKVERGGTVSKAPLGYLNVRKEYDGHLINSIDLDPVRAPLVRWAFEQYATGQYSLVQLAGELEEQGLTMRRTPKFAERPVDSDYLVKILGDPYYTGVIRYKGELRAGRHEPLISKALFLTVQRVLNARSSAGDRDRIHYHYLRGLLYCGECRRNGHDSRLVYSQNKGNGGVYEYYMCAGKARGHCSSTTVRVDLLEQRIEELVAAEQLLAGSAEDIRAQIDAAVNELLASDRETKVALRKQILKLEAQETRLLDLASDGALPSVQLKKRLESVALQREAIEERLFVTSERLTFAADQVRGYLDLLERSADVYSGAPDDVRRELLQAFFTKLLVETSVDGIDLRSDRTTPNETIHAFENEIQKDSAHTILERKEKIPRTAAGDQSLLSNVAHISLGLNKTTLVDPRRFELLTSSMRTRRATNCAKGP